MLIVELILPESQLTRKAPSSYSDGVYMMAGSDRPSPRFLSQVVMKGEDGLPSTRNLTTLFAFFGKSFCETPLLHPKHFSHNLLSLCPFPCSHVFTIRCNFHHRQIDVNRTSLPLTNTDLRFHHPFVDHQTMCDFNDFFNCDYLKVKWCHQKY